MQVGPGLTLASRYRLVRLLGQAEWPKSTRRPIACSAGASLSRSSVVKPISRPARRGSSLRSRRWRGYNTPTSWRSSTPGTDARVSFVVMQLIDGVTLAERTRGSALAAAETARVGRAVADALAHVHSLGMVHRDIKPGNILCGANGTVFLTDFGIVRLIGRTRLTSTALSARSPIWRQNRYAGKMSGPRRISMLSGWCCSSA